GADSALRTHDTFLFLLGENVARVLTPRSLLSIFTRRSINALFSSGPGSTGQTLAVVGDHSHALLFLH
ncbi:hypothetical protein PFISCL1PPCAC_17280, partial [Pristionchus fissidentatus]